MTYFILIISHRPPQTHTDFLLGIDWPNRKCHLASKKKTVCVCLCGSVAKFLNLGCRRLDADLIAAFYFTFFKHPRKNAFPRHNTIPRFVINGTPRVTLFANLGYFNQCLTSQADPGAHWNIFPVNARGGDVFGKITKGNLKTFLSGFVYFFGS